METPIVVQPSGPNIIIRVLWFLFIGLWLGAIVSSIAWLCNVTIIGLPLGLWLIDRLPTIITLRPQGQQWRQRLSELSQEVEEAVKSPRSKEIAGKIEDGLNRLAAQVDAAARSPQSQEAQRRVSQTLREVAEELREAVESPPARRARGELAQMLRNLSDKVAPAEEDKPS